MIREDCIYYKRTEKRCEFHIPEVLPCDKCDAYIDKDEMKRQVEIMRRVRERIE